MSSEKTDNESDDAAIEAQRAKAGFRFTEDVAPGLRIDMELKRILHSTCSPFQKIDVVETYFGKTLVTDGKTQSSAFDEFAYHESLVHPPLLQSALLAGDDDSKPRAPRSVFIGGGGELATAREVLRHRTVERVVMVDVDEAVINVSKLHLPEWGGDAVASDPRLELIVGDAHAHLQETSETFDVIIMDISDPIEAGPGIMLYTEEFYRRAASLLNDGGVFVTQAGVADSIPPSHAGTGQVDTACFGPIRNTLGTAFDCAVPYSTNIPSYGSDWGFVMAFNAPSSSSSRRTDGSGSTSTVSAEEAQSLVEGWANMPASAIDDMIDRRITHMGNVVGQEGRGDGADALRHYDGTSHRSMFALTKSLRDSLRRDTRIMTKDNPIFMY